VYRGLAGAEHVTLGGLAFGVYLLPGVPA
jgi:hypothetical protein